MSATACCTRNHSYAIRRRNGEKRLVSAHVMQATPEHGSLPMPVTRRGGAGPLGVARLDGRREWGAG
jgi:hypothetical protein